MRDNAKKVKPVNLGNDQHELSFKMEQGGKETCDKKNTDTTHKSTTVS